jgi:hypothetical protein
MGAEVEGARAEGLLVVYDDVTVLHVVCDLLVVYDDVTVDGREAQNGQVDFDCVSIPLLKF